MAEGAQDPRSGVCPNCGVVVPVPEFLAGMWSGAKPSGTPAGGGYYQTTCGVCGIALEAYHDVHDESGQVPIPKEDVVPELFWSKRDS